MLSAAESYLVEIPRPHPGNPPAGPPPDWVEVFGRDRPLRVEIGFGKSEFLIDLALSEPDYNYVGFEYSRKRVRKFLKKVQRRGAPNIRAVCQNVSLVFDWIFQPGSVDRFFVLFPDPWPKRRHAKHRFIQDRHIASLVRHLRPGGGLSLRTDDPAYAAQMLEVLEDRPDLTNLAGPCRFASQPRDLFTTLYQLKWEREGRKIHFLEYERNDVAATPLDASRPLHHPIT